MADDGELVESGSFRIDRSRALEKLKEFRFTDPARSVLSFIRAAVEAGAGEIRVQSAMDRFSLEFDGRPIEREDPFEPLFSERAEEDEAGRQLALGLLGALALKPERVSVRSGRTALTLRSVEEFASVAMEPVATTLIAAYWNLKPFQRRPEFEGILRAGCAMLRVPLRINDEPVATLPESEPVPVHAFEDGSLRGFLVAAPVEEGGFPSLILGVGYPRRLHLYEKGVRVATVEHRASIAFDAHLESPALKFNATHTGVQEDDAYRLVVASIEGRADRLVQTAAEWQIARSADDPRGRLTVYGLGAKKLPVWLRLLGRSPLLGKPGRDSVESARHEARVCAWLRYAAKELLSDPDRDGGSPARAALWRCPLYLSATGKPLSLLQLHRQYKRIGYVPVTEPGLNLPDPFTLGFEPFSHVVWKMDDEDNTLHYLFGGALSSYNALASMWDIVRSPLRRRWGLKDKDAYDAEAEKQG